METKNSISIKRSIAIKAVVTPTWKEDAEKELSKAISNIDQLEIALLNSFSASSFQVGVTTALICLLYTSPSPRDREKSRMPSSA